MKVKTISISMLALLALSGCVTADKNGIGINGTCIVCIGPNAKENAGYGLGEGVIKDNIVVGTTFNSPTDVDSTYAAIKSEFQYRAKDEFSSNTPDQLYVAQEMYKHVKTPGSYYHISDTIQYQFNGNSVRPIVEFEIIKRGPKAKIKLFVHDRLSDNDEKNQQLMDGLLNDIKKTTQEILR